jgi:hypothetical protein
MVFSFAYCPYSLAHLLFDFDDSKIAVDDPEMAEDKPGLLVDDPESSEDQLRFDIDAFG